MADSHILIVGPKGKTGSRVAARLQAAGIPTRGVSRATEPAFDWADEAGWARALEGITGAYLTYHPDLSVPQAAGHIERFCELAAAAGVAQVVLLSGRGEPGAQRAEQALRDSGLAWNILQASWFAQNFSESFMLDAVQSGMFVVPTGTAAEPFIDIDDIAEVAVATLLEPGLRNRLFELTGPQLLSFEEVIQLIQRYSGSAVTLKELPLEDYLAHMAQQQLPATFIELLRELFGALFDGRNAHTAQGVREALGRPARDFEAYVRKTAVTGIWQQAQQRSAG
ncbi:MAG: NmrA family transcriptional regulator [Pseudomonadota bacterium]